VAEYEEALRLNPEHAKSHYYLGKALELKGHPDEAAREYAEAQHLDPRLKPPTTSQVKK
jgi:tetratricopeptide (TPR) repeat protein